MKLPQEKRLDKNRRVFSEKGFCHNPHSELNFFMTQAENHLLCKAQQEKVEKNCHCCCLLAWRSRWRYKMLSFCLDFCCSYTYCTSKRVDPIFPLKMTSCSERESLSCLLWGANEKGKRERKETQFCPKNEEREREESLVFYSSFLTGILSMLSISHKISCYWNHLFFRVLFRFWERRAFLLDCHGFFFLQARYA